MWTLETLRIVMPPWKSSGGEKESGGPSCSSRAMTMVSTIDLFKGLPDLLIRQYDYEEPILRTGGQISYSSFFKTIVALSCDLTLDQHPSIVESYCWTWFKKYCAASRVMNAMLRRTRLPSVFCKDVRKKIGEMCEGEKDLNKSEDSIWIHEDHKVFRQQEDEQLLAWLCRRQEDWTLTWGGTGTIYGWGHNHRGQLGGVEGAKVKVPTPCHGLSSLRPVQVVGGEQTLFAVTAEGRIYASGYGAGGRLGIGGVESVTNPTLLISIQHVFMKKVAVNSGGKHCLALSADGDVYCWGEGDDGKLGLGNKR